MTCKIERLVGSEQMDVLRVCGHIQAEHLRTIEALVAKEDGRVVLDLGEVTLVDRDAVGYLAGCELRGIALSNCPPFLREWVSKEQLP